ncbi:DNA-binding response regulator [Halomicronema hongdechloris C2206]|uniref:DNA-binding response regulator n=1 Tax=Halomicronema hongdechloris C2206 TaxID=1641165 RepID=A0A1Z3HQU0_9CYAN|nr:response regulator transcription factor [Halomicronema hongdechloris]ASC72671.1 DNA-binding response regulator [Halomicronema hongdechloris C2206]
MGVFQTSLNYPDVPLSQAKILLVDDEALIRETIAMALEDEGYLVSVAEHGHAALEILKGNDASTLSANDFDLAILDWMLPGMNGLDLCRLIRHHQIDFPILILSAKGSEMDRVVGLEVGADDYLSKPFGMRELIARCRALMRRHRWSQKAPAKVVLTFQEISLYLNELRVTVNGQEINLSPKEFRILELFMSEPQRVWSREDLIQQVWGPDFMGDRKTVDVHIRWLREKIEPDPSQPRYITTLRGFGYRFG